MCNIPRDLPITRTGFSASRYVKKSIDMAGSNLFDFKLLRLGMSGLVLSLFIPMHMASATTYTSIANGSWNSSSTWENGQKPDRYLGGDVVTINHRVTYSGDTMFIENGTLNVSGILISDNQNLIMEDANGEVNITQGLIIIDNGNLDFNGDVTFSEGGVQICNSNYANATDGDLEDNPTGKTFGDGYIYIDNGNVKSFGVGHYSSEVAWCTQNSSGSGQGVLPPESCNDAKPSSGDCKDELYYLTLTDTTVLECGAPLGSNLAFDFQNPVTEVNNGAGVGHIYRFSNVSSGVDALVEIVAVNNAELIEIDLTSTGLLSAFQPQVKPTSPSAGDSYIDFEIRFVDSGTSTLSTTVSNADFIATAADVDGNDNVAKEFVRFEGFSQYVFESPSNLIATIIGKAGRFTPADSTIYAGIDVTSNIVTTKYTGVNTFQYRAGVTLLWDISMDDLNSYSDFERMFTVRFDCISYDDPVVSTISYDYSDAPSSYGEAGHKIPDSVTLYLGATSPDDDSSAFSSANADGDDTDNTDDEDGITPPSTAWLMGNTETLSVAIQGTGYLSAWIDWNLDGAFDDADEQISNETAVSTGTTDLSIDIPVTATSGDLPARFRLCSTAGECNTPTGQATDGEVEDYLIAIATCTDLSGDVSEIAAGIPFQVASGNKVFVASNSPSPNIEGHLKAYSVQADGSIGTTVAWDAASLMSTAKRQARLYSTDTSGTKILFNSLDSAAFVAGASPTVAKIKEYTITPSVDSGAYLAGRTDGSFLGPMSRGNDVALLTQMNNIGQYLADAAYRTFYTNTVSSRSEKILVSSDDGFLYGFDQTTGQLTWGWMPRSLAEELKNYTSFQSQIHMRGTVDIIDAKDILGNYASYVVGSYKDGLGHYVLKLDSSGGLDSVVWDQDYSASFTTAPNHGEMDYFRDNSGLTYVTYVVTTSSNQSTLVLREITTAATNTVVTLNFNATSTPFVIQDFSDSNGPAAKTLYLGDDSGNIQRTALLSSGILDTAANLKTALEGSSVGTINAIEPILFLGAASSNTGGQYFLRAQSESRLTLLDYNSSTTNWDKRWTSYVGGAGSWDSSNAYTADTSGAPTDVDNDGFFTNVTANGIQSLPADARITDAAHIVANNVILPVSVQAAGTCYGKAYFYLYNLTNGVFPDNKLLNLDSTKVTGDIALGYGDPSRVNIADMPSNEYMLGYGLTDQNTNNDVEADTSFRINDKLSTGIRGWKERRI